MNEDFSAGLDNEELEGAFFKGAYLELRGVNLCFGKIPVLREVSLKVAQGERLALLGPSGTGKTTVLRLIAGLLRPNGGDITLAGRSLLALPAEKRGVVLVFQDPLLFPYLNLRRNVGFGLALRGLTKSAIQAKVDEALEQVRLGGLGLRMPHQLSGGQQQRAALARALVLRPQVLLLDEPLSNLDPGLRQEMRDTLNALHERHGTTTVLVTHDQEEALQLGDRVALLLGGRIPQIGPGREFFEKPATEAVARFFGASNFIQGTVRENRFHCDLGALWLDRRPNRQGTALATIRPEHVRILTGPAGPAGVNVLPATLRTASFRGNRWEYALRCGNTQLSSVSLVEHDSGAGEGVSLCLPPERIHVFNAAPGAEDA